MSNREWRCVKLDIPANSSLWALLSAEHEYERLLVTVTERIFEPATAAWLAKMIEEWPVDVTVSPQVLLAWYIHITDLFDIDTCVSQLAKAAILQAQLDKIVEQRQAHAMKLVRSMQRDLNKLRKLKAETERAKRRKKKLKGRR